MYFVPQPIFGYVNVPRIHCHVIPTTAPGEYVYIDPQPILGQVKVPGTHCHVIPTTAPGVCVLCTTPNTRTCDPSWDTLSCDTYHSIRSKGTLYHNQYSDVNIPRIHYHVITTTEPPVSVLCVTTNARTRELSQDTLSCDTYHSTGSMCTLYHNQYSDM